MGTQATKEIAECQVVKLWQDLLHSKNVLTADDGRTITIIYPGRANDGQGADFRDAVIATRQGWDKGDIEIHVHSSDWRRHQHHRNPLYNRVILHVVMKQDSHIATRLQNGKTVPTITLDKYIANGDNYHNNGAHGQPVLHPPCSTRWVVSDADIASFLDSNGDKRFLARTAGYEDDISRQGPGQSLYQGIMEALGYSRNKLPFRELAYRLPIHVLESIINHRAAGKEYLPHLQALLLGTAGLLGSKHHGWLQEKKIDNNLPDTMEKLWPCPDTGGTMSPDAWEVFRVRPANLPQRRIIAMSYLLRRYQEKGMLAELVHMVDKAGQNGRHLLLEASLIVQGDSYQGIWYQSRPGIRPHSLPLLGKTRAASITVNVLLPFACAWGKLGSQPALIRKSRDLYRSYPRLAVNAVERHMIRRFRLNSKLVNSARRQQGLIHIYQTLCTEGKCDCCPLGKSA